MGLETGSHINSLDVNNPASTDGLSQADDHFRFIKSTIKNTFPNIAGPVTCSPAELNVLDGFTGTTADINKIAAFTGSIADLNVLSGHATEFEHVVGVTSAIQTQLDTLTSEKAPIANAVFTGSPNAQGLVIRNSSQSNNYWTVYMAGSDLVFTKGGFSRMIMKSNGDLEIKGNVTAFSDAF